MAQINIKVKINEKEGMSISFKTPNDVNNVSTEPASITTLNEGVNGISFATGYVGMSSGYVGDGGQLQSEVDKYNGFMFGAVDETGKMFTLDENGNKVYDNLIINLAGTSVRHIIIYFDKTAQQYATSAIIDGDETIYNDGYVWTIDLGENSSTHTIEFLTWSRVNYNACFTLVQVMMEYLTLNKNWINNLSSLSQSTTNAEDLQYGLISNTGSVDITDNDEFIADLIIDGVLDPANIPVQVFINDTLVQNHITTSSKYDTDGSSLKIDLSNTAENFSKLNYAGYPFNKTGASAYMILYDVLNKYYGELTEDGFKSMCSEEIVYGHDNRVGPIYEYLRAIVIMYPYIKPNRTYASVINEICCVCQLQVFLDKNNKLKFISARPVVPNINNGFNYIVMNLNSINSAFEYDLILKNKYDSIEIDESLYTEKTEEGVVVGTSPRLDTTYVSENLKQSFENGDANVSAGFDFKQKRNMVAFTACAIKNYYAEGDFQIPIKSVDNFEEILSVDNKTSKSYNKNYVTIIGEIHPIKATVDVNPARRKFTSPFNITVYEDYELFNGAPSQSLSLTAGYYPKISPEDSVVSTTSISANDTSELTASLNTDEGVFNIHYKVLVAQDCIRLANNYAGYSDSISEIDESFTLNSDGDDGSYRLKPVAVEISVYGTKETISFSDSSIIKTTGSEIRTNAKISSDGVLLSKQSFFNSLTGKYPKMPDLIANNVLSDYSTGIRTAQVTLNCMNFYYKDGTLAKDWSKGEIIEVGDILGFNSQRNKDKSVILWKVTGREFIYDGEPLVKVELMECKLLKP